TRRYDDTTAPSALTKTTKNTKIHEGRARMECGSEYRSNLQDPVCHTPPMSAQGVGVGSVRLVAVSGLGQIRPGDDLVGMLTRAIRAGNHPVAAGDIVVVTQKIVSKSEGALVALDEVTPSAPP